MIACALPTSALALTRQPDCGIAIAESQAFSLLFTGALLIPGYPPGDREVRPAVGLGATWRTAVPLLAVREEVSLELSWSAGAHRRLADSRFFYRAWSLNAVDPSQCHETHSARSRFTVAVGAELVRGELFHLEIGLGPQLALFVRAHDDDLFRDATLGAAPYVRAAWETPDLPVGLELLAWYTPSVGRKALSRGQLDVTFFMRFDPLTLTATIRGEAGEGPHPIDERVTTPTATGSVLIGARL